MSGLDARNTTGLDKEQLLRGLSGEAAKVAVRLSFEDIAQLVAQAVQSVLPARFRFVLIMVAPDGDVKVLDNAEGKARDVIRHVHETGQRSANVRGAS